MRTHDSHVTGDGLAEAITGNPATESRTAESPTAESPTAESPTTGHGRAVTAPNVRVAPPGRPGQQATHGQPASPGPGGAWCATDDQDTAPAPALREAAKDARGSDQAVSDPARRPGRPRSERAEQAIIDATIEAIGEHGIDGVSCEDVASRAGVGKATLYRRWAGKEDLLIAAFEIGRAHV